MRDRNDEQAQMGDEQSRAIAEILETLDRGERLNSAEMLLLRWFCGIPETKTPKEQMSVWNPESERPPF